MKNIKRAISILLAVIFVLSAFPVSISAVAAGSGTEENPYQITTASQLQDINNNLSAHYKLINNIDLGGMDFTPIGNADSGTFTGSFDGNGFVISNLNVFAGKYAGLFGCNEGKIKNVKLSDIYVYGTRYIGGVVGENTACGEIENCRVISGKIESGGGGLNNINIGGICGYNEGKISGFLINEAEITASAIYQSNNSSSVFAGGIIGVTHVMIELKDVHNKGDLSVSDSSAYNSSYYIGGLVGYAEMLTVKESDNKGSINSEKYDSQLGGILGAGSNISIINSFNTGYIIGFTGYSQGGFVGYASGNVNIQNSYNSGSVLGCTTGNKLGGFIGAVNASKLSINTSYNSGAISSYRSSSTQYLGGFIGLDDGESTSITNCYNSGNVSNYDYCSGGFLGYKKSGSLTVANCYDSGNVVNESKSGYNSYFCSMFGGDGPYGTLRCSNTFALFLNTLYTGNNHKNGINSSVQLLRDSEFKKQTSFKDWDFENTWGIDETKNSGFPYLKNSNSSLELNVTNKSIFSGESFQLQAFTNGLPNNAVTWSISAGNATVNSNGMVTAVGVGCSTITATDAEGNKANCNIYSMQHNTSVSKSNFKVNINETEKYIYNSTVTFGQDCGDYLVNAYSSNDEVFSITSFNGHVFRYTANAAGSATLYFETAQGYTCSCTATVTEEATSIEILNYTSTFSRGNSYQFKAKTSPNPTSSSISWESSDENVATVDNSGKVTAVGIGSCRITVRTDNGYSTYKDITVDAPITSMEFEQPSLTIYKGDTQKLNLIYSPIDTTDSIYYSVSNYSTYGGLSVDSSGLITAKTAGTYKVIASSNGVEAYCNITVKDIPVIVDDITLDQSEANIRVGEVFKLSAAVAPENATDKTVTWASTDESVAAVSGGGMVEAIGAGKAVITASSSNGIVAACEVTVTGTASINCAKLYIPDVISTTEGIVEVPVMIENNPGISFASYNVRYNPEAVEPIEVNNGDLFDSVLGSIESSENRVKLYFTSAETVQEDGVLASIRFRILDAQKAADIKLAYYPGNIREGEQNAVALNIAEGFVDLKYYPPFSLTYTCPEVACRQATLIVSNGKTQYISESDNGVFFLDSSIIGGTYNFYVKPRYGIATLVENKFNFGSATLQSVEMEGHTTPILGDVNEDDVIDIADISMLLSTANYGNANTEIDLTGDGIISIDDISVALKATNYGMRSAIIVE